VQAAASYSGYCLQYLRRLLRNGKLEGVKIGQLWLVDKGAFDL
jgi:excisionase family DNA binding protein